MQQGGLYLVVLLPLPPHHQAPHTGGERLYGTHFNPHDKIGVLLNMDEGTLTFTKDCVEFDIVR